jgi:hypothetical protein
LIYKTVIKSDGTALDVPTVAGELPLGEIAQTIDAYLGYVVIGLGDGFRVASSDDNGNLIIGPKISTGTAVEAFAGVGQYIYFAWKNFDSTSTGIGRMDLSVFISPNQPAYASDLMVTGQGGITDIHEYQNKPVFAVSGLGFYTEHSTNLVSSGYLTSGIYRWGVPDAKFIPKIDIRTYPLVGSVTVSIASDNGDYHDFTAFNTSGAKEKTIDGLEDRVFEAEVKLTLTRATTTTGPTVTRWMARAYAAPLRSQIFSVPILMHHRLNIFHLCRRCRRCDGARHRSRRRVGGQCRFGSTSGDCRFVDCSGRAKCACTASQRSSASRRDEVCVVAGTRTNPAWLVTIHRS